MAFRTLASRIPVDAAAASLRPGMELAGRKALLTGATGGLGRAIAKALAGRGRDPGAQRPQGRGAGGAGRGAARRRPPGPARRPGRARRGREARRGGRRRRRPRRQRRPARRPAGCDDFSPSRSSGALRVNLEAPMLMARALVPGDGRARLRPPRLHRLALGQGGDPALLRSTTRPSSACAASPSACAPTSARRASASRSSPRASSATPACSPTPAPTPIAGVGTGTPEQVAGAVVKAIERNKVEIVVAPLQQRAARPLRAGQPRRSRSRSPAAAPARRPPRHIADGHPTSAER